MVIVCLLNGIVFIPFYEPFWAIMPGAKKRKWIGKTFSETVSQDFKKYLLDVLNDFRDLEKAF
jgi:hypothetical protein